MGKRNPAVQFVEWCGKHPFATGLFALLSVAGLVLSIYWQSENSRDASRLQASVDTVQKLEEGSQRDAASVQSSVDAVQQTLLAACTSPPCWTASEALDGRLYQAPREMVDRKMPIPTSKDATGSHYDLQGCSFRVHFSEEVVSYYSISLMNGQCPPAWSLFHITTAMPPQTEVTVGDLLGNEFSRPYPPEIQVAAGCIDCGNAYEPYMEFVLPGSHAANFYTRYFSVSLSDLDDSDGDYRQDFIASLKAQYPNLDYLYAEQYCGFDLQLIVLTTLRRVKVESIGFGFGSRQNDYKADTCNPDR